MTVKQITELDLHNLENKIKLEVSKEQTELRHEDRKKLSDAVWKVDWLEIKAAVNDNILRTMSDNFIELKSMMKEMSKEIKEELSDMKWSYATKEEHRNNQERIETLEKDKKNLMIETLKWFAIAIGWALFWYVMTRLWIK